MMRGFVFAVWCGVLVAAIFPGMALAQAGGALGNGVSARATALGGATVASADGPLEAMQGNPAELTNLNGRALDLSVTSLFATGSFTNSVSSNGTIQSSAGTLPYGAFGMRLGPRFVLGFSSAPDTLMKANWTYLDPPGTAGATYGLQENRSTILALRSSAGLGFVVNRKLSLGASLGAMYNANSLHAPYIFQQQRVIEIGTVLCRQSQFVGDPHAENAAAHGVTHGLPFGEVEGGRERRHDVGEANRSCGFRGHKYSSVRSGFWW